MRKTLVFTGLLLVAQPVMADTIAAADCGTANEKTSESGSAKENYKLSYARAECFRLAAASAGAEWLKTEDLLLSSAAEAAKGNWDGARELVQKARFQAEAALLQAGYESQAWRDRVVRK